MTAQDLQYIYDERMGIFLEDESMSIEEAHKKTIEYMSEEYGYEAQQWIEENL